jgi:hypothetical protein
LPLKTNPRFAFSSTFAPVMALSRYYGNTERGFKQDLRVKPCG